MTYTYVSAVDAPSHKTFIFGSGAIAELFDEQYAGWVVGGLNYAGAPGGLGEWTYHRSDLHPAFWTVRTVEGAVAAYVSTETFAQLIAESMTDYPNERPE